MAAFRLIDSPDRGVLLLDTGNKVTFANLRAGEIFGVPVAQLIGADLPDAITHRDMEDGEIVEEVIERTLGQNAVFHRYSAPVFGRDGKPSGRVEIYSDITARRELEKEILDRNVELAELNEQLEEAQEQLIQSERLRALGEMAAGVAHDINNILGIILGNAQLAKRKLDKDSAAYKSVAAIELAARDGAETVRRLREIGKPIDGASYMPVDLSEIVDHVVKGAVPAWRESTESGGAEVSVKAHLAPGCTVIGNPAELREALSNIVLNAMQSIDGEGVVEVFTLHEPEHVDLIVRDTGIGMNEETRKRLFDPFFTTRGAEGTGLGMSMVDAIAIRHRGKVIVDSEEGKGTTITLRFPKKKS